MADSTITTQCCIVVGGPTGMMLGFLLARACTEVAVLEKHADFFRDFRGDTVHPSTLELIWDLGLSDEFLKLPHQKVETLTGQVGAERVTLADLRHVPTHFKFIVLISQWEFLNFVAEQGKRYKTFDLHVNAEATDLIWRAGVSWDCARRRQAECLQSVPTLSSVATDVIRPCARKPDWSAMIMARRWMCSGFACRAKTATAQIPSGIVVVISIALRGRRLGGVSSVSASKLRQPDADCRIFWRCRGQCYRSDWPRSLFGRA